MIILTYLIFTIPVCFILTRAVYQSSKQIILIKYILKQDKAININHLNKIHIAKMYILRKQWLSCILMLEHLLDDGLKTIELYSCLGFCYLSTKFYTISEDYYKKALRLDPSNIECLRNLANVYSYNNMNNKTKLEALNKQIEQYIL